MKIVIRCAKRKRDEGYWQTKESKPVLFVAHPELNPDVRNFDGLYDFPDAVSDHPNDTWRKLLSDYNKPPTHNPFNLHRAYDLYKPKPPYTDLYRGLVTKFGVDNVYILSAGWGLIRSDFFTPQYDITFSNSKDVKPYQKREKEDNKYKDYCMLPKDTTDTIVCLGSNAYIPLFRRLTTHIQSKKVVFYNSCRPPNAPGWFLKHYDTNNQRAWVYECARNIIDVFCPYSESRIKQLTAHELEKLLESI